MNNNQYRILRDDELDNASGGERGATPLPGNPGWTYCNIPGLTEGLYAGNSCPMSLGRIINECIEAVLHAR